MLKKYIPAITILYSITLLIASLTKPPNIPKAPANSDKIVHFVAYTLLTILWYYYFYLKKNNASYNSLYKAALTAFVFGIIIEALQAWLTSNRQADIYDVVANAIGIVIAAIIVFLKTNFKVNS